MENNMSAKVKCKQCEKNRKAISMFCHTIANEIQPVRLLDMAQKLKDYQIQIETRDDIIRGFLKAGDEAGLHVDNLLIRHIKELVNYEGV